MEEEKNCQRVYKTCNHEEADLATYKIWKFQLRFWVKYTQKMCHAEEADCYVHQNIGIDSLRFYWVVNWKNRVFEASILPLSETIRSGDKLSVAYWQDLCSSYWAGDVK